MLWRHGDVLIQQIDRIPEEADVRRSLVLVYGESTGHSHRIAEPDAAQVLELDGLLYVHVIDEQATIIHEEHAPITLPQGLYSVWVQREYTPERIRRVVD